MNDLEATGSALRLLRLLLVDDDEVSREVLTMLLDAEGYKVATVDSGESALAWLAQPGALVPDAVLTDLQMPGITGAALAKSLRQACGEATVLLAMSGSKPSQATLDGFDGFLLKPFAMDDLAAALAHRSAAVSSDTAPAAGMLDQATYDLLKKTMGEVQLGKLFEMCLSDAAKRIGLMREALAANDAPAYKAAAHAIKGGCGLVGATELYGIANELETRGPESTSLDSLDRFVAAAERLQRMLVRQVT